VLAASANLRPDNTQGALSDRSLQAKAADWERIGGVPMYSIDALSRRAHALQLTPDAWGRLLRLNSGAAQKLGLDASASLRVTQGGGSAEFDVRIDDRVPDGCIWLPTAVPGSEALGPGFGPVSVEKA